MFAVIRTGGKQYRVSPGQRLKIEKLDATEGAVVHFGEVLLVVDGERTEIGTPLVNAAAVNAKVLAQGRDKKKIVFKYHAKSRYRKKRGHRQPYTEVEIQKIVG